MSFSGGRGRFRARCYLAAKSALHRTGVLGRIASLEISPVQVRARAISSARPICPVANAHVEIRQPSQDSGRGGGIREVCGGEARCLVEDRLEGPETIETTTSTPGPR